ncbi:MAG: hypothetical protein NTW16_09685, partial [Bacteroidetes bacterium]|nr:hypothetical protein [Bacteroidota bacterium]
MKTGGKHPDLISAYRKVKENLYSVSRKKEYQTFFFFFIFLILYKIGDFIWEYIELHKLFGYAIQSSYNFLIEIIPAMTAWFFSL